jgi:prefoldin subunit 5
MNHDEISYDDLSSQELADEIAGLDKEIEDCQASLGKLRRSLKQKQDLRESLIEICTRKKQAKGWSKH